MSKFLNIFEFPGRSKFRRVSLTIFVLLLIVLLINMFILPPRLAKADTTLSFNEGGGTTVSDGNGNVSGSITNALWRTDELCFDGKCLYFDGSGDFVNFTDDSDLDYAGSANFTLEGWFRTPDITSGTRVLIAKYNSSTGTDGGYKVYMDSSGYLVFGIDDDQTSFPEDSVSTTTTAFDDNKWHHFAAVKTGTTSITIYVDGRQYQSDSSISATGTLANTDSFYVGIDGDGSSNGFSGFLDQIKVYNSARTAAEIKADILGGSTNRGLSASLGSGQQSSLSSGLVGYWKMDEGTGTTTGDSSGNGNTSSVFTGNATWAAGKFGTGITFDNVDDVVRIPETTSTDLGNTTDSYTVSAWVNTTDTSGSTDDIIAKHGSNSGPSPFRLYLSATTRNAGIVVTDGTNTVSIAGSTALNDGRWHQVVGVRDAVSDKIIVYVDGVVANSAADTTTSTLTNNDDVSIGNGRASYLTDDFNGNIDEARLYNRALTPSEVAQLYNWAPGPVGWWKLEETTGASALDSSGNNNTLSDSGGVLRINGKIGKSMETDNNETQQLTIANASQTGLGVSSSYSLAYWINISSNEACDDVMGKSGSYGFYLSCGGNQSITGWYYNGSTSVELESGVNTVTVGNWAHVEFVHDNNSDVDSIYINGVLSNRATSMTTNPVTSSSSFNIGGTENFPSQLNGKMDDVKMYNYARNAIQVIEDMNGSHPAPGSPVGSAVGYWKMDEGSGTTANDSSPNGNSLTLSAASWTNNGKFAKAWNGDGTNPHLSKADDADFDFEASEDFTLSAWVKSDSTSNPGASQFIFDKQVATNNPGYRLYFNTSGQLVCDIDDDTTSYPEDSATTTIDYYDNTWHNVLCVRDITADKLSLYVDGKLAAQDTDISATGSLANADSLTIGAQDTTAGGTDDLAGDLDEIKIYRSALSSDQVNADYNNGKSIVLGALSTTSGGASDNSTERSYCPPGDTTATCSPVGEWLLDDNSGTTAKDTGTVGNGGSFSGAPLWIQGKIGQAVILDGTDDYVNVPYSASQDPAANLSVGFWFRPTVTIDSTIASNKGLLSKANTNTDANNDWVFFWNSADAGRMRFGTYGDNIQTNTATWTAGVWYYIEVVVSSTNTANVYVNGKLDTYNNDSNISTDPVNGNQNTALNIGLARVASGNLYFNGAIDHVRLYDYARSASQIAWDYSRGNPVSWWRFDETTGSNANNAIGNGYTGTITIGGGGTQTTTTQAWSNGSSGKFNSSINLDGNDDYIEISESDSDGNLDFEAGDSITVSAWINPSSLPAVDAFDTIVSKNNSSNGDGYYLQIQGDGAVEVCIFNGGGFSCAATTIKPVVAGSWQHIVHTMTFGTDSTSKIYHNGKELPHTFGVATNVSPPLSNDPVVIGANNGSTENLTGKIDDVRMFRYISTLQQVRDLMNQGAVRFSP